jgi:two-component system, LytTR family, sensor kinase
MRPKGPFILQKRAPIEIKLRGDASNRYPFSIEMNSLNAALLINLLGFTAGIALYTLLATMVVRHRGSSRSRTVDLLLVATSLLGLLWNAGELGIFVWQDFGAGSISPLMTALSYSALGFLPSVVVHSAQNEAAKKHWLTVAAYTLSAFAAMLHFRAAFMGYTVPADLALQTLTFGSLALAAGLLVFNFRQTLEKKAIWASALLVFALSAFHLTGAAEENSWFVELVSHQSSIPLALAILYQNYRFAFADLFLKRAISLMLVVGVAFGLYVFVASPLLRYHETHDRNDVLAISLILVLWCATALIYPALHKFAVWLVDRVILQRADYEKLEIELGRKIEGLDSIGEILDELCREMSAALTAKASSWSEIDRGDADAKLPAVTFTPESALIFIPTAEMPYFELNLAEFDGGRRLLSEETAMLEAVSLVTARRIDALRVSQERFRQTFREQEFEKLATEAQLAALRSQINPHFLFNALTTIGYLIQTTPEKAFDTLMRLTQLLRGVLTSTGEFCTLGQEMKLIESYLEIERARFEERLKVEIDVPEELEKLQIPTLILQPLVENAIKHGISESKSGGEVRITARLEDEVLRLTVSDTGPGLKNGKAGGVGLKNIRERLNSYYGEAGRLDIASGSDGTTAKVRLAAGLRKN